MYMYCSLSIFNAYNIGQYLQIPCMHASIEVKNYIKKVKNYI